MSTVSSIRPPRNRKAIQLSKPQALQPLAALPKPPAICESLTTEAPTSLTETERIRYIHSRIKELPEQMRLLLRLHIEQYARHMVHIAASDMDAGGPAANECVWYRVDGVKKSYEELGTVDASQMDVLLLNMLTDAQLEQLAQDYAVGFSFQVDSEGASRPRMFRTSIYFDEDHLAINVRVIKEEVRPLESLGFHAHTEGNFLFSALRDGLTLITGVTGSGKSTTLDAIVDANNRSVPGHIVIIGNPVEYRHRSNRCIIRHREVGRGVASFRDGIVQAMHQDPDMIVIGEMLDPETISATLDATDSGHRVFSTLHTRSAIESIDRIIAEYPSNEQDRIRMRLGDVLNGVVSQKLCPMIGGGRVLAKEVLWMTPSVRAAVKNNNLGEIYQMMWEGSATGQQTMEQDLHRLYRRGLISAQTAMSFANNKKRLRQLGVR